LFAAAAVLVVLVVVAVAVAVVAIITPTLHRFVRFSQYVCALYHN